MSEAKPSEPIWPIRLVHIARERDRARDVAVALEQENTRLRQAHEDWLHTIDPDATNTALCRAFDQEEA
jgi:hypothetical protein